MHWQHLSTQYDELSYCFDGLPHESSSTIFASCKRISKLGWLAIYTQWVQVLYEEGFSFFHRYFYNISNSKKGEGSKSGQNCQRIVLKNCWHDGCQKSEKTLTLFMDGSLFNYWQIHMAGIMQWSNLPMLVITMCMHSALHTYHSSSNLLIIKNIDLIL